ncbi:putative MFS family arabinose efflux permease [Kribbella voronezhensis]|uniref:Putative MFS family arabinose efflux permease n=1 Tax=Kribbella voronezhensis TaxID=2512212 RepID=A0A4R7TJ63_9ACTN|nr:MFS transporter [Kribbella voronezhensis]TDU91577.1 putative MFS family arabinose efflux permease [Kribbella voronezhensis]
MTRTHTPAAPSVFGSRSFRSVFTAAAVSQLGTQVGYLAVPLIGVQALAFDAGQLGLLATLGTAAFLLIGLPAGAWIDVLGRRPVMVVADLSRALLVGSIPVATAFGVLSATQLYLVVFLTGVGTVFFDVSAQSLLPGLVGRQLLTEANTHLVGMNAVADVSGRSAGGWLVQLLTAPFAVVADAVSYLASAWFLLRIDTDLSQRPTVRRASVRSQIAEGLVFVAGEPLLRAIAVKGMINNLSIQLAVTVLPLLFVRDLHLSAGVLGGYLALGGVGVFIGSRLARPLGRRLGQGRASWVAGAATAPVAFLVPLIDRDWRLVTAGAAWIVITAKVGVDNVLLTTFRQQVTPDRLLGRVNATMRFLLTGSLAIGSAVAGVVGQLVSVRAVLCLAAVGLAFSWIPLFLSPLRRLRVLPTKPDGEAGHKPGDA